jgi:hypothetical protein
LGFLVLNVELMEVIHSGFDRTGRDASPNGTCGLCIVSRKLDLVARIMHKSTWRAHQKADIVLNSQHAWVRANKVAVKNLGEF